MNFVDIYNIVFRCILIGIVIYHVFKRQLKVASSVVMVFVLSYLSLFLDKLFQIIVDPISNFLYLIILFMALYLGSSLKFYDKYKNWDRYIHSLSGIAFVGFGIATVYNDSGIRKFSALLLGFTFSVTIHVFWEILEYIIDCLFQGNAQRWQKNHNSINHVSPKAIQPAGLVDTMNDLSCCVIGSGLATIIWLFIL